MRDTQSLLKLLQLELAAHPPGAPVIKVWITAEPAPPRSAQHGFFLPVTPEAEKLEITLARISAIVGERRAGIARLLDTHHAESFLMDRFVARHRGITKQHLHIVGHEEQPVAADLSSRPCICRSTAEGRPAPSKQTSKERTRRQELQGKVLWSAGPWRSSGDWWMAKTKNRHSQQVQVPGMPVGPRRMG